MELPVVTWLHGSRWFNAPNSLISRLATMNVFIFDRAPVCCDYIYQTRKLGLLHPSSGTMSPMSLPGSLSAKLAKKTSCQARVSLCRSRKSACSQATPITSKSIQEDKKNTRLVRGRASDGGSHRWSCTDGLDPCFWESSILENAFLRRQPILQRSDRWSAKPGSCFSKQIWRLIGMNLERQREVALCGKTEKMRQY